MIDGNIFQGNFHVQRREGSMNMCKMSKTSKDGQKIGHDIQMAYYFTFTAHIQVLSHDLDLKNSIKVVLHTVK